MLLLLSFNRTIVELKSPSLLWAYHLQGTFNRTIVELKSLTVSSSMADMRLLIVP